MSATPRPSSSPAHRGPQVLAGPFTSMMSVKDLSNYLNVSRSTIRRMCNSAQIPFMRVRGRVRFDALAVRAALDKKT